MMTRTGSGVSLTISSSPSRRPVHGWPGSLSSRPWRCDAVTLTEFLAARLGEAEERAGYVHDVARDAEPLGGTGRCVCGYPARMLREVAAKRKILSEYNDVRRSAVDGEYMENGLRYAVETLKIGRASCRERV